MSLISRTISNMFGGVSQQPAPLRSDSQCELMDNCWPDVAVGLAKRPPSIHIARINTDTATNRAVHIINRDATEKYAVTVKDEQIKVYDLLTGTEKTVTTPDGVTYLDTTDPKADFAFLTVADTTYIVNRSKTVTMDAAAADGSTRQTAIVKIVSLPVDDALCTSGGAVKIVVNGTTYSSTDLTRTKATHAEYLALAIKTANPTMEVTHDEVDSVLISSAPGGTLTVTAYTLDETSSGGVCTGTVQNNSGCTVTTNSDTASNVWFVHIYAGSIKSDTWISLPGKYVVWNVDDNPNYAKTSRAASWLAGQINVGGVYTATVAGSVIKISKVGGGAFTCTVGDTRGDTMIRTFTDSVESSTHLPPQFWTGYTIKVRGAINEGEDDYYVKFEDNVWKETVKPGLQNTLTSTTMPHKLVRQSNGTFVFEKIVWDSRAVGDADSNPAPSFVGQKINNVFFFRERLGLLSGENLCMSRATDYYNFFANTASGVSDDDPIDVTVADTKVAQLYHAIPYQESLLIFSDTAQFQLTGGDVLSPKTVRLDATTRFNTSKYIPPAPAGRDVYFAVDRGNYSSIREYFVLPDGVTNDALDVTAHVPSYVPKNIGAMVSSTLLDVLFIYSKDAPSKLYLYKYLWSGDQKVQSAWGSISFDSGVTLIGMELIDTKLYLVIRRSDGTYLEYIDFEAGGTETDMDFRVYLDRRYSLTGVYDLPTNTTTWTLPYADTGAYEVVLGSSFGTLEGAKLNTSHPTSTTLTAIGDFSAGTAFVGKPYTMTYRLSEQYVRKDKEALQHGILKLKTLSVSYSDSAYFKVAVTPLLRDTNTFTHTGKTLGTASSTLGQINISSGIFKVPVITGNQGLTLDLINDSPLPSFFQGFSWEGTFTARSRVL